MKNTIKKCASMLMLILLVAGLTIAAAPALAESSAVEAAPKPTSVRLSASKTLKLAVDSELTLTPTLTPANAATTYTWKSSKKSIAAVANGVVTGKKSGTATITVTTANKKKSTVKIKVYDPYLPTSVKLDKKGTVKVPLGDQLTLNATLAPETAQSGFTWKSSKRKVATVSGGVVTAKKVGTTTITVTTRNKKKATVKVKVYDPYLPTSVKMEQSGTQTVLVMNQLQLSAVMSPATARSALKWKSSKKKVATVDANGVVSPIAPGTTTITVTTRNSKKATIKVKVVDDGNQPITTQPDYNLPYVIYASKNSHTIAILARDENGEWNRVIRTFPTGTGKNNTTDVGIFFLTKKERWHKWGKTYSPYANKLSVGIYLHGPIYKSKSQNAIMPSYYNVIGKDCSSGCLRTISGCAAWVYYNCPVGTQVIIAQNSRFSAPKPTKISSKAKSDPTDPGSNPEILVTGFSVEPGALTLDQGASQAIAPVNVYPANTSTAGFTYATNDGSVATVSESGVVTAVGPGSAAICVTANDDFRCTVLVPVTVNGAAPAAKLAEAEAVEIPDGVTVEEEALPAGEEIFGTEETAVEETPGNSADDAADDGTQEEAGGASEQEAAAPDEDIDAFTMEAEEVSEELDEVVPIEE